MPSVLVHEQNFLDLDNDEVRKQHWEHMEALKKKMEKTVFAEVKICFQQICGSSFGRYETTFLSIFVYIRTHVTK